jgi:hypothetical protein
MSKQIYVPAGSVHAWVVISLWVVALLCVLVGGPIAWFVYGSQAFAGWAFLGLMISAAAGPVTIVDPDDERLG